MYRPSLPSLLLTEGGGGGSVHMLSVTCCNLTYLPNNSMCILPTFLRTFLIISVILDQDPYVWFRRDTERRTQNINASLFFETLEKLLKELQNPAASLDLILTEQLQTKQVCWDHCLLYRPSSGNCQVSLQWKDSWWFSRCTLPVLQSYNAQLI